MSSCHLLMGLTCGVTQAADYQTCDALPHVPFPGPFPLPCVCFDPGLTQTHGGGWHREQDCPTVRSLPVPLLPKLSKQLLVHCRKWLSLLRQTGIFVFPWQCCSVTCRLSEVVAQLPHALCCAARVPWARQDSWQ